MEVTDLSELMPHIVVNCTDCVHVIPVKTIRDIASGRLIADNELVPVIAQALLIYLDG